MNGGIEKLLLSKERIDGLLQPTAETIGYLSYSIHPTLFINAVNEHTHT